MKLIKFGIIMAVMALLLGAYSARAFAIIGTVTNYSKLTVSIVVTTNGTSTSSGNMYKYPTGSAKITNKYLLDLFAHWAGTTWPAGAQLVQGWDTEWDGDVLVVDKTGTNVLFDADVDDTHYFTIDMFEEEGAYSGTKSNGDPGSYSYTWLNEGYFVLYDDEYYLPYTYLVGYGPNTEKFTINWNSSGDYTTWNDSESGTEEYSGYDDDLSFLDNYYLVVNAQLSSSGHGNGDPDYLY